MGNCCNYADSEFEVNDEFFNNMKVSSFTPDQVLDKLKKNINEQGYFNNDSKLFLQEFVYDNDQLNEFQDKKPFEQEIKFFEFQFNNLYKNDSFYLSMVLISLAKGSPYSFGNAFVELSKIYKYETKTLKLVNMKYLEKYLDVYID